MKHGIFSQPIQGRTYLRGYRGIGDTAVDPGASALATALLTVLSTVPLTALTTATGLNSALNPLGFQVEHPEQAAAAVAGILVGQPHLVATPAALVPLLVTALTPYVRSTSMPTVSPGPAMPAPPPVPTPSPSPAPQPTPTPGLPALPQIGAPTAEQLVSVLLTVLSTVPLSALQNPANLNAALAPFGLTVTNPGDAAAAVGGVLIGQPDLLLNPLAAAPVIASALGPYIRSTGTANPGQPTVSPGLPSVTPAPPGQPLPTTVPPGTVPPGGTTAPPALPQPGTTAPPSVPQVAQAETPYFTYAVVGAVGLGALYLLLKKS